MEKRKKTDSNLGFGVERAVLMKRVKMEGKKGDIDRLYFDRAIDRARRCRSFPAHPGFCCAQH